MLSDGTIVWTGDAVYQNDIIGLARADNSGLYQKQSHTLDDSLKIYIGSLSATNSANAGTITNNYSDVLFGHNAGKLKSTAAAMTEMPSGITSRFEREWKVTNTNFSDDFSLEIEWDSVGDFTLSDIRLLVDDDGDFSNATAYASGDQGMTFSIGSIIISGIPTTVIPSGSTKYITIGSASAATTLPVELKTWDVQAEGCFGKLTWSTASELNNDYFLIQYSYDGQTWTDLDKVYGAGNSNEVINYEYYDFSCFHQTTVFYRMIQVDFDGTETKMPIKMLNTDSPYTIKVYPNPAKGFVNIDLQANLSARNAEVIFRTVHGKEVMRQTIGNGSSSVNISGLAPDTYMVKVVVPNQLPYHSKLVVVK